MNVTPSSFVPSVTFLKSERCTEGGALRCPPKACRCAARTAAWDRSAPRVRSIVPCGRSMGQPHAGEALAAVARVNTAEVVLPRHRRRCPRRMLPAGGETTARRSSLPPSTLISLHSLLPADGSRRGRRIHPAFVARTRLTRSRCRGATHRRMSVRLAEGACCPRSSRSSAVVVRVKRRTSRSRRSCRRWDPRILLDVGVALTHARWSNASGDATAKQS